MRSYVTIRMVTAALIVATVLGGWARGGAPSLGPGGSIIDEEVSAAEVDCDAIRRRTISSRDYVLNRPDDFYALCYARDPGVCATAREYLNDVVRPKADNKLDRSVFQAIGARFWKERTTLSWRNEIVNAATLDIFNNGKLYAVFQSRVGYGGIKVPTLFVSESVSNKDDATLDLDLFLSVRNLDESKDAGGLGPRNLNPIFPREYWWAGSSVAQINSRNYVVFYAPADSFQVGRVSIIEMKDRLSGEHVCKFQARYQISEK